MKSLLFTILIFSILSVFATPLDSIGTKTVDDKTYIIHQVEQGETLYRLKVKYNVSVEEIKAANNNTSSLAIGQKVLIPTNIKVKQPDSKIKFHTVAPGETLYRVASTYEVSVDEVKKWNNLTSNSLSVGQKLQVSSGTLQSEQTVSEIKPLVKIEDTLAVSTTPTKPKKNLKRKAEIGSVSLGKTSVLNSKYHYCVHPSAPIGSLVVLTCNDNAKVILVKVVGNAQVEGQILQVNKAVIESLGLEKESFSGSITFLN